VTISRSERLNFERFTEADEVADYETWRLAQDSMTDPEVLLEQGAFRAGQLSGETSFSAEQLLHRLIESLAQRFASVNIDEQRQHRQALENEFSSGQNDAFTDCYHISRERWFELA
jgi:hypothetical protein